MDLSADNIWNEFPNAQDTYKEYLTYADKETLNNLVCNKKRLELLSSVTPEDNEVCVANLSKYYPLECDLDDPVKCSMMHIRGISGKIVINFDKNIYYGTACFGQEAASDANEINYAFRSIVPSCFSKVSQVAGPMGLNEILLDGSNMTKPLLSALYIYIHPDSPMRIKISKCPMLYIHVLTKDETIDSIKNKFVINNEYNIGNITYCKKLKYYEKTK
jgi:hypothetical protein